MSRALLAGVLALTVVSAHAQRKSCEELKGAIEAKIKSHGVKTFTLEIVPTEDVKHERVVGSCDGGKKAIVYKRGG